MGFFSRKTRCVARKSSQERRCRLQLESLEARCLLTAGALDQAFGMEGVATLAFRAPQTGDAANVTVVQADGKIIVAGSSYQVDDESWLVRYNTDGSLDDGSALDSTPGDRFGDDGKSPVNFRGSNRHSGFFNSGESGNVVRSLAVQADGKIVAVGYSAELEQYGQARYRDEFAIARFNTDGSPDTSFGVNGNVLTDFVPSVTGSTLETDDRAHSVAIQPNGKIVVAGSSHDNYGSTNLGYFALARYNSNGSLDSSFDGDGKVWTFFGSHLDPVADSVTFQTDGTTLKIVAAGHKYVDSQHRREDFVLARYLENGSLDTSFDSDGKVVTIFESGSSTSDVLSISVQTGDPNSMADDKIVVAGQHVDFSHSRLKLARYHNDGSPDISLDSDGTVLADLDFYPTSAAIQPDGKIVIAGTAPGGEFALARYTADGILDSSSFGVGGHVRTTFTPGGALLNGIALHTDGIVAVGQGVSADSDFVLVRYNANGAELGYTATDIGGAADEGALDVAVQPDGKLVIVGYSDEFALESEGFTVFRYDPVAKQLDADFGDGGKVTTDFGAGGYASRVALQPDGKIVVAGYGDFPEGLASVLARYNPDGSPDLSFGDNGTVIDSFGFGVHSVAIRAADGKIVLAGEIGTASGSTAWAVALFNSNGTPDLNFGDVGKVVTPFETAFYSMANSANFDADGKIVAAGIVVYGGFDWQSRFGLVRYNANGSLDTEFDLDGKVVTHFDLADPKYSLQGAAELAIQTDGKIVVAGTVDQAFVNGGNSVFALARYNANGSLDTDFDFDGKVVTRFETIVNGVEFSRAYATSVALQADGKIVVGGSTEQFEPGGVNFAIARYTDNGSLDPTFDGDGRVLSDFNGSDDRLYGLAIQPDGKIVAVGAGQRPGRYEADFVMARYHGDDFDADGIADSVDILPLIFSDDFSDAALGGATTGTITNRGDGDITIVDSPDPNKGVRITSNSAANFSVPNATISVLSPTQFEVTQGSVILNVLAGTVAATFVADTGAVATAGLNAGNELTFEPDTFTFVAPATNTQTVEVLINGSVLSVGPGQTATSVQIDIKPGSDSSPANLASNGMISVAILSAAGFDAQTVDVTSIIFAGAHAAQSSFEDVNGDGLLDLVVFFRTQDTTLRSLYEQLVADDLDEDGVLDSSHETASIALTGLCQDGTGFLGSDTMDLFLSGKALRDLLAGLAAAGAI